MELLLITDGLTLPIDEGFKKFCYNFFKYASKNDKISILTTPDEVDIPEVGYFQQSKLLVTREVVAKIAKIHPKRIVYFPASSSTFFSFIRTFLLKIISRKSKVWMVSIQKRDHAIWQRCIIKLLGRFDLIVFSEQISERYSKMGINTSFHPLGVDPELYKPVLDKTILRKKYGYNNQEKILLHVGHIKETRNLQVLKPLAKNGYSVIVIGGPSEGYENDLIADLIDGGITVINTYLSNIEEFYQLADCYIFPVQNREGAIEFPLSILEAMSCNLPIVTTPFGGLPDFFEETEYFKYFETENELLGKVKEALSNNNDNNNREIIINNFSWDKVFCKIINEL